MARRRLPKIGAIADRRATDRIEYVNNKLYLVNGDGLYAPVQVQDEEREGEAQALANIAKMPGDKLEFWAHIIAHSSMTFEAKRVRLAAISARWHELYGDTVFVVTE